MTAYLVSLNREQLQAVQSPIDIPILVVAGAGTGKTKTLTTRILHLINEHEVAPSRILALTFTNKAAQEMDERIRKNISLPFYGDERIGRTFHSLGVSILRENYRELGIPKHFTILDDGDRKSLIREAMKYHDISTKEWEPRKIVSFISKMKALAEKAESFSVGKSAIESVGKLVWTRYEEMKREQGAMDFDDLLVETYFLLKKNEELRKLYQERWPFILVDEYQDTNRIQQEILSLLLGEAKRLFAVGDGDQNIYSWRGADMTYILNFQKHFPEGKIIILEQNYRSTGNILKGADAIISRNKERVKKVLRTEREEGEKISLYEAYSAEGEADWVARKSKELIASGVKADQIAVLFRTNFQSRLLEEAFLFHSVPYHLLGVKFFARKEVKDIISYLRVALNRRSLVDLKRVINLPKRGIGKVSLAKIFAGRADELSPKTRESYQSFLTILYDIQDYAKEHKVSEIIHFIIERTGLEEKLKNGTEDERERLGNMRELASFAMKYDGREGGLELFLEEVSLLSDQDSLSDEKSKGKVRLMTIHASKGLEFDFVFVTGLEQGLFPGERIDAKNTYESEEERRLCYVAFTRAREKLFLSYAKTRLIYGEVQRNEASEFLFDLPKDILDYENSSPEIDDFISYDEDEIGESTYIDENGVERRSYLDFS